MSKDAVEVELSSPGSSIEVEEAQVRKRGVRGYFKELLGRSTDSEKEKRYIRKVDAYLL
jgi:hypothetical protein